MYHEVFFSRFCDASACDIKQVDTSLLPLPVHTAHIRTGARLVHHHWIHTGLLSYEHLVGVCVSDLVTE